MYTQDMLESIRKVEATRVQRLGMEPRRMTAEEKEALLNRFHPDYKEDGFELLKFGPNAGDKVPAELAALLQGRSRIEGREIALDDPDWDVDVLKVGHHGSDTSSSYRFIYETQPEYGIVSVGWDNPYGHPDSGIMKRYADAGTVAFRTDRLGTVIARSDGKTVTLTWENRKAEPENALPAGSIVFIGNVNSGAFHRSDCVALPKESNRIYFESYLDALEAGYSPCGNCLNG